MIRGQNWKLDFDRAFPPAKVVIQILNSNGMLIDEYSFKFDQKGKAK
ncbi:unnamed protein product, partial [marine sediment metagenome]